MESMTVESPAFWNDCPLVWADPETKHGAVVFKETRLEPETVIGAVDAYMELEGLSEDEAIEAAYKDHPTAPGKDAIRQVLAYFEATSSSCSLESDPRRRGAGTAWAASSRS
jgi:uncharacterized protein (DUF433 family)